MARKKIREYHGKRMLMRHFAQFSKLGKEYHADIKCELLDENTNYRTLAKSAPWLTEVPLVAKPDMMFGQRGKHDLVLLNADLAKVEEFVTARMGKVVEINGVSAPLTHFLVEPFVPHKDEYYLSISVERDATKVLFSPAGGIHVEENWDKMQEIAVPVGEPIDSIDLSLFANSLSEAQKAHTETILEFIRSLFRMFEYLDFSLLEINPFVISETNQPVPLDLVAEVDDTALFKNERKWGELPFPNPFGRLLSQEEEFIQRLDEKTGASLKLTILNPHGRIWNMVAGGGASVIFADTVCDLGYSHELANYGEYSGAPSEEETYLYAKTLLSLATRNPDPAKPRVLLIGGGIANFTDVAITFKGIIHALLEAREKLVAAGIRIWVRRGGVNAQQGLQIMRDLGKQLGLPVEVYGPETHMTFIVQKAIKSVFEGQE